MTRTLGATRCRSGYKLRCLVSTELPGYSKRNIYLGKAARCGCVYSGDDMRDMAFDHAPSSMSQNDNGHPAARKVLLVSEVFAGRNEHSNPSASALPSNAPFSNSSHPRARASVTV